jgi:redox-sensitive bicupin YhaK (pirin superfamily)
MSIQHLLTGHNKDLGGGFIVRRLLPSVARQAVGPFLFFDHFGPVTETPDTNHDVRPHPHIGLATVTYLFEGAMTHHDSVGGFRKIEPGAINWMTAGRGIVHSERKPEDLKSATYVNHGLQLWAALPAAFEEVEPSFVHTPAAAIPELAQGLSTVRVLIGEAYGLRSPVATFSNTLYLDVQMLPGAALDLPPLAQEMAVYVVAGDVAVDGTLLPLHTLAVLQPDQAAQLTAASAARLVVVGGDALDGHRFMSWNFVSSRKERIAQAEADWAAQRMGQVPGETEFIPLPSKR